jgi:hypothetical protein
MTPFRLCGFTVRSHRPVRGSLGRTRARRRVISSRRLAIRRRRSAPRSSAAWRRASSALSRAWASAASSSALCRKPRSAVTSRRAVASRDTARERWSVARATREASRSISSTSSPSDRRSSSRRAVSASSPVSRMAARRAQSPEQTRGKEKRTHDFQISRHEPTIRSHPANVSEQIALTSGER